MTVTQKQNIERLRLQGLGYKRIADTLDLSVSTVKSHCQRNNLPVGVILTPPAREDKTPKCKQCGKPLERTPKKRAKSFCCDKCRYAYWNTHQDERRSAYFLVCVCCGKAFASASRNRKYCGHACYINDRFPKEGITCEQGAI